MILVSQMLPGRTSHMLTEYHELDRVFTTYYDALVDWCAHRIPSYLGAPEEFVHQTYLRCRTSWRSEKRSNRNEAAFLFRCLRWVVTDSIRSYHRRKTREHDVVQRPPNDERFNLLRKLIAREALNVLCGMPRLVCVEILSGKSQEQILADLQISKGALATNLSRAKVALLTFLEVGRQREPLSAQSAAYTNRRHFRLNGTVTDQQLS